MLDWDTHGRSHLHDGYRIDPANGPQPGGWVLRVDEPEHPVLPSIDAQRFRSLKSAKAAAMHHRVLTIRRMKLIRHSLLAFLGCLLAIPAFAMMGPGTSTRRVAFFAVGLVVLLLTLREMVGVLMIVFSQGWDYGYDLPRLTSVDRFVVSAATRLGHASVEPDVPDNPSVHVVSLS